MEQLNKTPTSGKFGDVAKVIDTNFALLVTKIAELEEDSTNMNCGFYESLSSLQLAYPNPEKGMMAYVGTGEEYTVYRCTSAGTWTKTSETYKIDLSINLDSLATKEALNAVKADVAELNKGAVYGGMASTITNPGTPTTKVYYLPIEIGTYTNFGGISITDTDVAFLYWDGSAWAKHSLNISSVIESAKSTANTANVTANNALEKAETAITNAQTAQSAADANKESIGNSNTRIAALEQYTEELVVPKIVHLTEKEYDSLELKETDTYYMLTED